MKPIRTDSDNKMLLLISFLYINDHKCKVKKIETTINICIQPDFKTLTKK